MLKEKTNSISQKSILRKALRLKGQFWTPDWVADIMADYVLSGKPVDLLDPAVGDGALRGGVQSDRHWA